MSWSDPEFPELGGELVEVGAHEGGAAVGLGAAGGVETGLTALTIKHGIIPPTINLDNVDPECQGVDHVANTARQADVSFALSNAFGFGGHNAVIALARMEDAA